MTLRCVSDGRQPSRAAAMTLRAISSLLLVATLYLCVTSLGCVPFRWTSLLAGGVCAALLSVHSENRNRTWAVGAVLVGLLAAWLLLSSSVRAGAKMACNALFSASETVNRYVYTRIALPPDVDAPACQAAFGAWLAVLLGSVAAGVLRSRSAAVPLMGALFVIAFEIYFGIVPATPLQLTLLGGLAIATLQRMANRLAFRELMAAVVVVLILGLLVATLLPGVNDATERHSEQIRDWLSARWPGGTSVTASEERSLNHLRQEALLTQENAEAMSKEGSAVYGYERRQRFQRDISDPRSTNYGKTLLLLLLVVVLLVAPFAPFLWLDRRKRVALSRRRAFDAAEPSEAIGAMFRHIVRCLTAIGVEPDSRGFAALAERPAGDALAEEYWQAYQQGALLWQEAFYSNHPMTEVQRAQIRALLKQTQRLVYDHASRGQRFRLQYVDGLILAEELE